MTLLNIKAACEAVGLPRLAAACPTHADSIQLTRGQRLRPRRAVLHRHRDAGERQAA
jgi:hypothetical protein